MFLEVDNKCRNQIQQMFNAPELIYNKLKYTDI